MSRLEITKNISHFETKVKEASEHREMAISHTEKEEERLQETITGAMGVCPERVPNDQIKLKHTEILRKMQKLKEQLQRIARELFLI